PRIVFEDLAPIRFATEALAGLRVFLENVIGEMLFHLVEVVALAGTCVALDDRAVCVVTHDLPPLRGQHRRTTNLSCRDREIDRLRAGPGRVNRLGAWKGRCGALADTSWLSAGEDLHPLGRGDRRNQL